MPSPEAKFAPDNQSGFVRRTKNWTNAPFPPIWVAHETHCGVIGPTSTRWNRAPAVSRSDFSPSSPNHAGRNVPAADVRTSARVPASKVFPITTFTSLGLSKPVLDALASKNYNVPTPIQAQAIPTVLSGRDLLGIAQTGTGKTAAFMLPSIDRLVASAKRPQGGRCRMLVLAPTRELASQIAQSAIDYARGSRLHVVTVFGGTSIYKNKQDMARGADILVATPGRLVDLVEQRAISLDAVEILVLDEADQMLDLGFIHALKWIVGKLPAVRQTLFFSATMPPAIRQLADRFLKDPVQVAVTPAATTVERIAQSMTFVDQKEKGFLLTLFLKRERSSAPWCSAAPSMAPTRSSASLRRAASSPTRSTATRASRSASALWPTSSRAASRC